MLRITPAYAGKSHPLSIIIITGQDPPRLCGEKVRYAPQTDQLQGSPPPMRGKAGMIKYSDVIHRITPAYAGKRSRRNKEDEKVQDHPRLCGEKIFRFPSDGEIIGSPPPMRGKVTYGRCQFRECRITPAYAGKSPVSASTCFPIRDHPRLCGEKRLRHANNRSPQGSPPPMRGKGHRRSILSD